MLSKASAITGDWLRTYKIPTGPNTGLTYFDKFLQYIDKSSGYCWEWTGSKCGNKYGDFDAGVVGIMAHRASYLLFIGPIPKGMLVCHHCDNPSCVNPDHLFLGTQSDNMQDMIRKQRCKPPRGEKSGKSKLTNKQVLAIRTEREQGALHKQIAIKYGISCKQVSVILSRKQWGHI